jgi:hypothetical protein
MMPDPAMYANAEPHQIYAAVARQRAPRLGA